MKKTGINKNCEVCKKEFFAHAYSIRNGHGRFCSMDCKNYAQKGIKRTQDNRVCVMCFAPFHAEVNQIEKGKAKFCSRRCFHKSFVGKTPHNKGIPMSEEQKIKVSESRRGKMTGESNHSWKGGITPKHLQFRRSVEYRLWRESVFARDHWTCHMCGQRGGKLHADHIKPFSIFPELRVAIDNGQTLCVLCHRMKTKKDLVIIRSMSKVMVLSNK